MSFKLTLAQKMELRRRIIAGADRPSKLALEFGINVSTVYFHKVSVKHGSPVRDRIAKQD